MIKAATILLLTACAVNSAGAKAGIEARPAPAYVPVATPICATAPELDARLTTYGFAAKPRTGLSRPSREAALPPAFLQEWHDGTSYTVLVRGNQARACVVAAGENGRPEPLP